MGDTDAKPLVVYTHWCPDVGPALLAQTCAVIRNDGDRTLAPDAIDAMARDAAAICYFVPDVFDEARIARFPRLRILAGFGKGFDNIDVPAATARKIWVTNVPSGLTEATADLAWALMLAVARRIIPADASVRTGVFTGWHPRNFLGSSVSGATLGLIGFGEIGMALARRARGFAMHVLHTDPRAIATTVAAELGTEAVTLDELLARSDYIIICAPLTAQTYELIDRDRLGAMKPTAHLVNVARGSLVNEEHVADALRDGRLAGYAADVFAFEDRQIAQRPGGVNERLRAMPDRVVLSAHLGTAVLATREELARVQATSVLEALRGERPTAAVNDAR